MKKLIMSSVAWLAVVGLALSSWSVAQEKAAAQKDEAKPAA
jgi:hypothetical protein